MKTSVRVAKFVDEELTIPIDKLVSEKKARMYAITEDGDQLAMKLVDTDPDPYQLLTRVPPNAYGTKNIVSFCMVMTGWMSRINEEDPDEDADPIRERVRITAAVSDSGVSVVVRRYSYDRSEETFEDGGEGSFPDALKAWWLLAEASIKFDHIVEQIKP